MDIDFGFLCDYADTTGKLSAIGIGFETIYAPEVPTQHPLFHAVLRLRFSSVEVGDKEIGVRIVDADGKELTKIDGSIRIEAPASGQTEVMSTVNLGLYGIEFPAYGNYAAVWLVGGVEVKRSPFSVAQPPTTA